ncbi:hypothetical protein OB236_18300 [Paenibacillus sp. WQ 127069]|uniref:Uncharacterized protein n=1 Tax=Paenibacillus baimaensis TaxID=2982185 RepID=A0ABT2UHD7_9BACL|nr:hypothetical protein [Paenibacillus sp. WQ 127069]MCU6794057.1 hypothetical protein [Paenibacillus sp. WQ 127069]
MRSYLILGMCGLFLIQYFARLHWLEPVIIVMTLIAFAGSATKANPTARWYGIVMLIVGVTLEWGKGTGFQGISDGISMNLPLLTLVILVPLLSLPLKLGGYFSAIHLFLQGLRHHPRSLFSGITSVLFILGPILNLGSVRMVDELLKDLKLPPALLAKSYLVGFSTTMLWSPYYAAVGLVLYYLQIPVTGYMAYGIGLALLFLLIGNILFAISQSRHPLNMESEATEFTEDIVKGYRTKLLQMGIIIVVLMTTTFVLESLTHWSMLVIVSLLAIAFPLGWGVITKGWSRLIPHWIDFRDQSVPLMNNEIVLYTSAGLLGRAMQGTDFGSGIGWALTTLANQSFMLFAVCVVVTIVAVTFIGIHPMVIVTALVTQMNAEQLGTTNPILAMLLMLAWSISSVLSPVNPLNLMVSRLTGLSGLQVGLRYNGWHLLIVAVLGIGIITIIH